MLGEAVGHRRRAARDPARGRRADPVRHPDRRDGRPPHVLRPSGVGAVAPGLKTIEDATEIRRRILIAFEAAEREADPDRRRAWMTFVLVGGGPTGVELAGALGEIAARHAPARLPVDQAGRGKDHPGRGDGPRPAGVPAGSVGLCPASAREARRRGPIEDARGRHRRGRCPRDGAGRVGGEDRLHGPCSGPPASSASRSGGSSPRRPGAETDRAGRVLVEPDLRCPATPRSSSSATRRSSHGSPTRRRPASPRAPSRAVRMPRASSAGGILGRPHEPFEYSDHGDVAVIGRLVGRDQHQLAGAVRPPGRVPRLASLARRPPRST